jgi:hypothetical protein
MDPEDGFGGEARPDRKPPAGIHDNKTTTPLSFNDHGKHQKTPHFKPNFTLKCAFLSVFHLIPARFSPHFYTFFTANWLSA